MNWARDQLDRSLARVGQDVTLQRLIGVTVAAQVICRAVVRGYDPSELIGGITQQDLKVILSPTQIIVSGWQSFSATVPTQDQRVPVKDNKVIINGKTRNVEAAGGIYVAGELVRIEMRVRG